MKVRNGFVSNSSSSSFILKFDKIPETKEELRIMLYGENPPIFTAHWDDDAISTEQVASIIFNDIESAHIMDIDDVISQIRSEVYFSEYSGSEGRDFVVGSEYIDEFDKIYDAIVQKDKTFSKMRWVEKNSDISWEDHHKEMDEMAKPLLDIIEKIIRDKYTKGEMFIETEYSDNDGQVFSYIEHSDVLNPIMVQRFSHH